AREPLRRPRVRHRTRRQSDVGRADAVRVAARDPGATRDRLVALCGCRRAPRRRVARLARHGGPVTLPFGVGALRFAWPAALLGLVLVPLVFLRARHALAAAACDLGAALEAAAPLCPGGKQPALVLFTDGNETQGSLLGEIALGGPSLPIFPVVPPAAALPAATVRRLLAPAFAPERSVIPVSVVLESRAAKPLPAVLEVR